MMTYDPAMDAPARVRRLKWIFRLVGASSQRVPSRRDSQLGRVLRSHKDQHVSRILPRLGPFPERFGRRKGLPLVTSHARLRSTHRRRRAPKGHALDPLSISIRAGRWAATSRAATLHHGPVTHTESLFKCCTKNRLYIPSLLTRRELQPQLFWVESKESRAKESRCARPIRT